MQKDSQESQMKLTRIVLCILFTSIVALSLFKPVAAQSLVLTLAVNRPVSDLGDEIIISGNLTMNGTPVTDGLVAIQVRDPRTNTIVVRTLNTGTDPAEPWIVEIFDFYTCNPIGKVQTSFPRGSIVGFTVKLINHASSPQTVVVPVYIQYVDSRPFMSFIIYNSTIDGGKTANVTASIQMPDNAPIGTTYAYASALTGYPSDNGHAYAPENATTFQITTLAQAAFGGSQAQSALNAGGGSFSISFKTNRFGGVLGNYTAYATSWYLPHFISNQTTVKIVLLGDITGPTPGVPDLKVDARDISRVARAYGSRAGPPPSPNWDPICDITGPILGVPDGKVDARDVAACARDFGKYGTLP
jgi:hypothetical protein